MKHDYTALDAAIVKRIREGAKSIGAIEQADVAKLTKAIADADNATRETWRSMPSWRVVDRRLQALRKAGKIKFVRGPGAGWEVA